MASLTSVESGNWSDPTVWDLEYVPQDSDSVTIANGHTVVFDVNQSSFPNGVALTVNSGGKLTAPTSGGPYYLKCSANINVYGTFEFGTTENPIPKTVSITIDLNNARTLTANAGSTVSIICPDPNYIYATLTQSANSGTSTIYIDKDLRNTWSADDIIYIFGKGSNYQRLTLVSVEENYVTVTPALGSTYLGGSVVACVSRNIKITQQTQTANMISYNGQSLTLSCWCDIPNSNSYILYSTSPTTVRITGGAYISGGGILLGAISGGGILFDTKVLVSNVVVFGYNYVFSQCALIVAKNCIFGGGNYGASVFRSVNAHLADSITLASLAMNYDTSQGTARNLTLRGAYGVARTHSTLFDNCLFDTTVTDALTPLAPHQYLASVNHNQVAGAFKSWSKGGITVSSTPPAGAIGSGWYKLMLTSSSDFGFYQMPITVYPGRYIRFASKVLITDNMTYAPKFQIVDPFNDPLVASNATPLSEYDMAGYNPNTLYQITLTYKNTGDVPKTVFFRVIGRNSSGSVYFTVETRDNRCENVRLWPIPYV